MPVLKRILTEAGIERPDGRPLYALPMTTEGHDELGKMLRFRMATGQVLDSTAARFVLWAAEYVRSRFEGGQLTWDFVFRGLGLHGDHGLGRELVDRGLRWWGRPVRISEAGVHLYLYTLMAEGGLPQALLVQQGLYSRVIKGLLADIEMEGPDIPDDLACRMAARRVADMPQTFQSQDIVRLLADLGLTLVRLRSEPPKDVPTDIVDRWLDKHRPGWERSLPLRLSKEVADSLIRPALRTERKALPASGPLAWRALIRDESTGEWRPVIRMAAEGFLASTLLPPTARNFRMRFLVTGGASDKAGAIVYSASPVEGGWELRRLGGGTTALPVDPDTPLTLAGFADGRLMGEVEIVPATPLPDEVPSLWKEATGTENGDLPAELLPLGGTGKTRSSRVWVLTAADARPMSDEAIVLGEPQAGPSGLLWPLSGTGEVRLGEHRWRIATGADEDVPETRLMAHGDVLSEWRLAGTGSHVFLGDPLLYGQRHTGVLRQLSAANIRKRSARLLMGEIAEWVDQDMVLARLRYVIFPQSASLTLREVGAGELELQAEGFRSDFSLLLEAGQTTERARLSGGSGCMRLSVSGAPPGIVKLRLSSPEEGRSLELVAPWPARSGMVLQPDNIRLERDTPLSVEALRGWRAIVPKNIHSEVQLRMEGQCIAMRVEGVTPLAAHVPLVRSMLAHAGPDSEVRLSLITEGQEGRRLEIRRYRRQADILNGRYLRLGLPRGTRTAESGPFAQLTTQGKVVLHAIDLNTAGRVEHREIEAHGDIDLRALLPGSDTVWLIQATLDGEVQRATVWSPIPIPFSSREQRIAKFAAVWQELSEGGNRAEWTRQWSLIRAAMDGGDAGVLDQAQALARVPQAVIRLSLRVQEGNTEDLAQVLALDTAVPIFWPAFPVSAFRAALTAEHAHLIGRYKEILDDEREAENDATAALARRIGAILSLHPELAAHFGAALAQAGLLQYIQPDLLEKIAVPASSGRFVELAQEAARRVDWLPSGIKGIAAHYLPFGLPSFNSHIQKLVDAPLATAEIAAGLRPYPTDPTSMLTLINLRLIDPHYFDSALPIALALALQKVHP